MWKEQYTIGVEQVDQQHKQLFAITEELLTALKDEAGWNKQQAKQTIDFLKSYIVVHFNTEEMHQLKTGYPDYERHCRLHRQLVQTVHEHELELIRADYDVASARRLAGMLTAWLVYHVMREDRRMGTTAPPVEDVNTAVLECLAGSIREMLEQMMGLEVTFTAAGPQTVQPEDLVLPGRMSGAVQGQVAIAFTRRAAAAFIERLTALEMAGMDETVEAAHRQLVDKVFEQTTARLATRGVACTLAPLQQGPREAGAVWSTPRGMVMDTPAGRLILMMAPPDA